MTEVIKSYRIQAETKTEDIDGKIAILEANVEKEQTLVDGLIEEKMVYEKEFRKLDAVRWVIIILCIVFDPLAVALLIAWNGMIEPVRRNPPRKKLNPSDDARYYWEKIKKDAEVKRKEEPPVVAKPMAPVERPKEVDPDNEPYNPESYELRSDIKEIIKKKDTENPK